MAEGVEEAVRKAVIELLERDREFRYAVAGAIGVLEVLHRLDRSEAELVRLREDMNRLREDFNRRAGEDSRRFAAIEAELAKLREDMAAGFRRHEEEIAKVWSELAKLREDMAAGFKRHDELLERHWREIVRLREDMNRGFALLERHVSALGARWGLMAEEAFREGLRGLLSRELGLSIERWRAFDESGRVFGYPSEVEVDVAIKDGRVVLIEAASHVRASDVYQLKRKAELYAERAGRRPDRLLIVTPYIDEGALEASKRMGAEVYTKV
ncbi:MAG: DUF3782 domain-containing protein [Candidatus Nezhaarchaeales archaeon]